MATEKPSSPNGLEPVENDRDEAIKLLATNGFDIAESGMNNEAALHWAAEQGNTEAIRLLAERGADLASTDADGLGKTALHVAASGGGRCEAITLLLHLGSAPSWKDKTGNTAMHYAAGFGGSETFKLLVDKGSDISWTNDDGEIVLHIAARFGREGVITAILEMGANIDTRDGKGRTPLHTAAWNGMHKAVQLLLDMGADITLRDDRGDTALHLGAMGRSLQTERILVQRGADLQAKNNEGYTALVLVAARGDLEIIQLLLDNGADISSTCLKGRTALHFASSMGHEEAMRLLIKRGADIEARDSVYGLTPLAFAAWEGHEDTMAVKFLADHGADVFTVTDDGYSALHLAAEQDQRIVAQFLVNAWRGWSLDDQTEDGDTALSIASNHGHKEIVLLLLKNGADLSIPDSNGFTPLHHAVSSGHMDVAKVLLEYGADPTAETKRGSLLHFLTEKQEERDFLMEARQAWFSEGTNRTAVSRFLLAAGQGQIDQLKQLLDDGLDVGSRDENGRRALSVAAQNGHETAVKFLIESGADVDAADKNGETPLWWAARYGHQETLVFLLEKGCRVDFADDSGQTPLSAAAQMGHESIVQILIERGANINAQSKYGTSVLSFAAQEGHLTVVALLLQKGARMDLEAEDGDTALSLARYCEQEEVVEFLLQRGAPEHSSAQPKDTSQPGDIDDSEASSTAGTFSGDLASAAKIGKVARIKRLIRFGTAVDCLNSAGRSPLGLAAENGHDAAAMELLRAGATVDFADNDGKTALWWAAQQGRTSTITLLADAGARTEARNKDGRTPLSIATRSGQEEAVRLLLHLDAKAESRDDGGRSPLFHAAEAGHDKTVSLLLDHGANVECGDKWGQTPLSAAVESRRRNVAKLLLQRGASMRPEAEYNRSPLCIAARYGYEELVELLLTYGADVNYLSDNRKTALMLAADKGHAMAIKILIEHGADVELRDDGGHNALSYAKNVGQEAPLKLLWQAATVRQTAKALKTRKTLGSNTLATQEWYEYEPLPEDNTCIRLVELRPGEPHDIIALELFTVSLHKVRRKPEYEAFSYEWGEATGTIPIQCNGNRLLITPNLKAALEQLRSPTEPKILWIDAVCINQEDIAERSKQVTLMTRIYREATRVLMWIGGEKEHTASAFKGLPKFIKAHDSVIDPNAGVAGSKSGDGRRMRDLLSRSVSKSELEGMADLYNRPYFTRAWIFQEILLSGSKGEIICGRHQCDWPTMRRALVAFSSSDLHGVSLSSFNLLEIIECEDTFHQTGGLELEELSDMRRYLKATDPRDKIYATLGVLRQQGKMELVPDYTLSVKQVYIEATRYLIRKTQSLGYWWSGCNRGSIKTIEGLPSWVPDWTSTGTISNLYAPHSDFVREVAQLGTVQFTGVIRGDPTTTDTTLRVNGYIVDRLAFGTSLNWGDDIYEDAFKPVAIHFASTDRSLFEPYSPEPGISNLEAIWNTISKESPDKDKILEFLAWKISADKDIPENVREVPTTYDTAIREWASLSKKQGDYDFSICKKMESKVHHSYDLVYTEKGRFALTNLHGMEMGLYVAALGGARDLALLRRRGQDSGERWYHYVDRLFMPDLEKMERPGDIVEHDKVERLEIR